MFSQKFKGTLQAFEEQIQSAEGSHNIRRASISAAQERSRTEGTVTASDLESKKTHQNVNNGFAYGRQLPNEVGIPVTPPSSHLAQQNLERCHEFVALGLPHPTQEEVGNPLKASSLPSSVSPGTGTVQRDSPTWIFRKLTMASMDKQENDDPTTGQIVSEKQGLESVQGRDEPVPISSSMENPNDTSVDSPDSYAFLFGKPMNDLDFIETHTASLFPIPKLWNTETSEHGPHFITFEDLTKFLREDTRHTLYVGQDLANFATVLERDFSRPKYKGFALQNLELPCLNQRVPIFSPKSHRLDPPDLWPLLVEYEEFVQREHSLAVKERQNSKIYRVSARKRLFIAAETSTLGFGSARAERFRSKWRKVRSSQKRKAVDAETNTEPSRRRVRRNTALFSPNDKLTTSLVLPEKVVDSSKMLSEGSQRPKRKVRRSVLYPASSLSGTMFDSIAPGYQSDNDENIPCVSREKSLGIEITEPQAAYLPPDLEVMGSDLKDFLQNDSVEGDVEVPEHMATSKFIDYILDWSIRTPSSTSVDIGGDRYTSHEVNHSIQNTNSRDEDQEMLSDQNQFGKIEGHALHALEEVIPLENPMSPVKPNFRTLSQTLPVAHSSELHCSSPTIRERHDMIDLSFHQSVNLDRHVEHLDGRSATDGRNTSYPQVAYDTRSLPSGSHPFAPPSVNKVPSARQESERNGDIHPTPVSHCLVVSEDNTASFTKRQTTRVQGAMDQQELADKPSKADAFTTSDIRSPRLSLETVPEMNETACRPSQHQIPKIAGPTSFEDQTLDTSYAQSADNCNLHDGTTAIEKARTTHWQNTFGERDARSKFLNVSVPSPPRNEAATNSKPHHTPLFYALSNDEVYLWNHETNLRSEQLVSIQDAVLHCFRSNYMSIYDGQDFEFAGDKALALTGLSKKDMAAWDGRVNLPRKSRKVRVWDFRMGCLKTHFRSPAVQRLDSWLQANPNCTVLPPWLLISSKVEDREKEPKPTLCKSTGELPSSLFRYIGGRIKQLLVQRIRDLRVLDVTNAQLSKMEIWNAFRRRKEGPRSFRSRRDLLIFLFQNPWLEFLHGQDEISELETTTCSKLVSVSLNSPAYIGRFWDTVENQVYDSRDGNRDSLSIGNFLSQKPRYVLYQGQDLACWKSLSKYAFSLVPFTFVVLLECGANIQAAFFSKRWITIVVDPTSHCTSCAVFWNKRNKSVLMQPDCNKRIPISSYLEKHQNMELYIGQDQPDETRRELQDWFQLIQQCRPIEADWIVLLTRTEFVPSRYSPLIFPEPTDEHVSKTTKVLEAKNKGSELKAQERELEAETLGSTHHVPSSNENLKIHQKINHVEVQGGNTCINIPGSEEPSQMLGIPALVHIRDDMQPQKCPETDAAGGMQRQTAQETRVASPEEVIVLEPSLCTSIGSDVNSEANSLSPELEEVSQGFEERLRAPARVAARMLTLLKEVGPRILKQELVHDLRQALYENFVMEVGSRSELLDLIHDVSDLKFVRMAAELSSELESLDVTGCFSAVEDVGYGASDILAVREELESGKMCTMNEVVRKFRVICQNLIHFNEGFYFEQEALDLKERSEEVIRRYMTERRMVFAAEARFCRLHKICERARQIGFRKLQSSLGSNSEESSPPRVYESSRNTPSGRARVTFLNYRDEKGNSVMGKRHSVRVFGLPIQRQECQRELGGVRLCHACGCDVFDAEESSLVCSNRFFGGCSECLCKKCVESVTCMESSEFISYRNSQNWICIHCRGLCPADSSCLENKSVESAAMTHSETVLFSWPYEFDRVPLSVTVSLLRREDNGEFVEQSERDSFCLAQSGGVWSAIFKCCIGAYRAFVRVNGDWIASTTFYVCSSRHTEEFQSEVQPKKSVALKYYPSEVRSKKTIVPRGPRVLWKVAEEDKQESVHAITRNDTHNENHVTTKCSRTQGYDWQRAKRHHVLHWRPCPKKADHSTDDLREPCVPIWNGQGTNMLGSSKVQAIVLSSSDKNHTMRPGHSQAPPKLRRGLSHKDFITEWNTFKYDEMLELLWGIITGRSDIHGIGLFTLTGYRKGDFIIEYAGDLIRTPLADIREVRYDAAGLGTYFFKINEQQIVDATVHSNRARFTNHSCDPNMIAIIIHVRGRDLVVLQATRDIPKLAELTFDYKLPYEDTKVQCLCNAWNCVGVMN